MSTATLDEDLELLGFSSTESAVYLACLEAGSATVSEVADRSGVSRRHVYDVLDRLEARGVLAVYPAESPIRVEPRPPDRAVSRLIEEFETVVTELGATDADDGTVLQRLRSFGLTDRQVEVVAAVHDLDGGTVTGVADAVGVSRQTVYRCRAPVAARGLVVADEGATPVRLEPTDPVEATAIFEESIAGLRESLEDVYAATDVRDQELELLQSRETVLEHLRGLVAGAEDEVWLSIPAGTVGEVAETLADARSRGGDGAVARL